MIDYKLHIPGPVDVSADAYKAMSTRVMGHRSQTSSTFTSLVNLGYSNFFKPMTQYFFPPRVHGE